MRAWAANCRLQAAFGAARRTLVSLRQLPGTSGRSIPALRKPNDAPPQRNLASREPIVALRKQLLASASAIAVISLLRHLLVANSQLMSSDSQQSGEANAIFFALSVVKAAPQARAKTSWHAWSCFERSDHGWNC